VVAVASGIAGLVGYGITIIAARLLGVDYGAFGVFWSALYFGVGALAGAQQEFARMTRSRDPESGSATDGSPAHRLRRSIGASAVASLLLSGAATVILVLTALRADRLQHAVAIAVGFAFFGFYAVLLGMQYGARRWKLVASMTVADPLLRLLLIVVVVGAGGGLSGAVWAAVAPFPILAFILLAVVLRDDSLLLEKNALAAVRAAGIVVAGGVAASLLINGVPLLFALVAPSEDPAVVSRYVFAFILVRAPLVVGALALQSFLIVHMRDHSRPARFSGMLVLAVVGATGLGSLLLILVGEPIIRTIGGGIGVPSPAVLVGIAAASGATSAMIIIGCLALALEQRRAYTSSWWAAALSVAMLAAVLPGEAETRITVASALAPVVGVIFLLFGMRWRR
jgi:hypothetical protein